MQRCRHIAWNCKASEAKGQPDKTASLRGIQSPSNAAGARTMSDSQEPVMPIALQQASKVSHLNAIIDTGSLHSVIPARYCDASALEPTQVILEAANGTPIAVLGKTRIDFTADGAHSPAEFMVTDQIDEALLGRKWKFDNLCVWHFAESTITVNGRTVKLRHRQPLFCVRRL